MAGSALACISVRMEHADTKRALGKHIRMQVVSDLHTEFGHYAVPDPDETNTGADAVILAGDIARAQDAVAISARLFPNAALIIVPGNHEHYRSGMNVDAGIDAMRRAAFGHSSAEFRPVHVLENAEAIIGIRGVPVRFIGCCLWTDFALFGDPVKDRATVEMGLNDFRAIQGRAVSPLGLFLGDGGTSFRTSEWLDRHDTSKEFLRSRLAVPHDDALNQREADAGAFELGVVVKPLENTE